MTIYKYLTITLGDNKSIKALTLDTGGVILCTWVMVLITIAIILLTRGTT